MKLVGVSQSTHTTHDTKDIVVSGIDTDFGSLCSTNSGSRDNKLKSSVVNTGEITGSRWLVLFWAKGERINVDTGVWVTCVMLVRLDEVEVGSFTLREAILAVKLKLSSNNWIFTPAVHVEGSLGKNKDTSIGKSVRSRTCDGSTKRIMG